MQPSKFLQSCAYVMCLCVLVQEKLRERHSEGSLADGLEFLHDSFPFDGLETQYLQRKYYKENFNLLVRF